MLHASRSGCAASALPVSGVLIAVMSFPLQVAAGECRRSDTLNPPLPGFDQPDVRLASR